MLFWRRYRCIRVIMSASLMLLSFVMASWMYEVYIESRAVILSNDRLLSDEQSSTSMMHIQQVMTTTQVKRHNILLSIVDLESLLSDQWQNMMRNIHLVELSNIKAVKPSRCGCGLSMELLIDINSVVGGKKRALRRKVVMNIIESDLHRYNGRSHMRDVLAYIFDQMLRTYVVPPTAIVPLSIEQLEKMAGRKKTKVFREAMSELECFKVISGSLTPALALKTASYSDAPNMAEYALFNFLSNCYRPSHVSDNSGLLISYENSACFIPKHLSGSLAVPTDVKYRDFETSERMLYSTCDLQHDIIAILKESAMAVKEKGRSKNKSLGERLRLAVLKEPLLSSLVDVHSQMFDDIDSRVLDVISHINACNISNGVSGRPVPTTIERILSFTNYDLAIRHHLRDDRIVDMTKSNKNVLITYEDGSKAMGKLFGGSTERRIKWWVDQGYSEVAAYHIGRILGINVASVCTSRRIYLDGLPDNFSPTYFKNISFVPYIRGKERRRSPGNVFGQPPDDYIDLGIVDWINELKTFQRPPPDWKGILNHEHDLKFVSRKERCLIGDLSDILLLDYVVQNWDRYHPKNFAMIHDRYVSFDNGLGFWKRPLDNCKSMLYCPPIFYTRGRNGGWGSSEYNFEQCSPECSTEATVAQRKYNICCDHSKLHFCLFRKDTILAIDRLANSHSPHILNYLRLALDSEAVLPLLPERHGSQDDYFSGLLDRMNTVLDHVSKCKSTFGDEILF